MNKILRTIVSGVGAGLWFCASSFAAPQYSVTDLGEPFAGNSYALGINNRGQVVGYWLSPLGARAFLRDGAHVVDLGNLGGTNDYALSLNAAGQVVGFSEWEWGKWAFVNDRGTMNVLETLEGTNSFAYGINDAGHIVGYVETPAGASAFLYRNAADILYLSPISYAFGINLSDQVVGTGTADITKPLHAFRWENGTVVDLTSELSRNPGWELTHARAINASGAIVGWGLRRGRERAYLMANGKITNLGVLRGGTNSYAFGLNNANQVVGATTLRNGEQQAFLWAKGRLIRLNDAIDRRSGWDLREARGINDTEQIVGWGTLNGRERAFLLTPSTVVSPLGKPAPEPAPPLTLLGDIIFRAASGGTTPVTNSPLADAHVRDGSSTNVNFGTNIVIELQTTNSATANNRDSYFKFGIDNAPSPLGSAILRVFAKTSASGSVTTMVYSVTDTNWTETGIKWTNKPALGIIQTNRIITGTTVVSYDINITAYIRSELAAGRGIATIALHGTNINTRLTSINSKENASNKPVLILNTNTFPTVSISAPVNNATFPTPTNLVISATTSDADGTVTNVDFYAGNFFIGRDGTSPFSFTWTNALVGVHGLKAVAFDNFGAVTTSAVVNVTLAKNLQPIADAHVKSDSVTSNFGTNVLLEVQTNSAAGPTRDAYFKFNLSGITNISNVKIRIFASGSATGTNSGTYFSVADTNWTETGITWSNKPVRSNLLNHVRVTSTTAIWITNDLTSFVQGENAAGRPFVSLVLHSQTNSTTFMRINSKEAATNRVELVITTTNSAPAVAITAPANNATFIAPADIPITASATDDGTVTQVEIFQGTTSLGVFTNAPYSLTWSNVTSGSFALTARAMDNFGLMKTSAVVNITVGAPPTVSVTNPAPASVFTAPATINLGATAADIDGTVAQVEFFAGTTSLGTDASSPYAVTWNSVPSGNYALTARATDNLGLITTSSVVNIVVDAPPSVTLTNPVNGAVFVSPSDVLLQAAAVDTDGTVAQVEFFAGTTSLGVDTSSPYALTWSNATSGAYGLTARATDNLGVVTTSAVVNIVVDIRPSVTLTNPPGGTLLVAPANILLQASATDADSAIAQVEFFQGATSLGVDGSMPYALTWSNVTSGSYSLTARVTDGHGLMNTSAVVNVIVDAAPSISLTSPANNTLFAPPASITIDASAADSDGTVTNVEFFAGATKLGEDNSSPYSLAWNSVPTGIYSLTARATDDRGVTSVSALVSVSVNTLPTVSIVNPVTGTNYNLPATISVDATASDSDGTVSHVDFYAGGFLIGSAPASPYSITWLNPQAGTFALTAVAVDNLGGSTTSSPPVYVTNRFSLTNLAGMRLWLDAGAGITTNASGTITNWADQSGNTNDARQTTAANQPLWLASTLNSRPVVRFDGVNDSFSFLNNPLNALTQAEVFVVTKVTADVPAANKSLWRLGSSGSGSLTYPATDGTISEDFGSTTLRNLRDPSQALDQYHIYNVSAKSGEWAARINTTVQLSATNNTVSFWNPPTLGSGPGFYAGDIAEMLIFNRVLSGNERELAERYLVGKYALTAAPAAPTGLTAKALSSSQISLVWDAPSLNVGVKYLVERKAGASGTFALVATITDSASYIDTDLLTSVGYVYRVRAGSSGGDSGYSNEASATTLANAAAIPFGSLILWLKGDAGHGAGNISGWFDQSPRGNHATQLTSTNRPLVVDAAFGGRTVVRFDGAGDSLTLPSFLTGVSQAEAFIVLKNELDTPTANRAIWSLGGTGSGATKYPAQDGGIVENFGSVADRYLGDPSVPLDQYHVFNVASRSNEWTARINGLTQFNTTNNTVAFWSGTLAIGVGMNTSYRFAGDMAEVIIFNQTLTEEQRVTVCRYLGGRYPLAPVPAAPSNLKATGVASNQISLNWNAAITNYQVRYSIERKLEVGGSYSEVAVVDNGASYIDATVADGNRYYYRVKAMSWAGDSAYSGEASAVPPAGQSSIPIAEMTLWLKADAGHGAGQFNIWLDQSGKGSHGTQTTVSTNRPQAIEGMVNGRPAVRFDGFGDKLVIPTNAIATPQAEAYVLLRVDADPATANRGLWRIGGNGSGSMKYPGQDGKIIDSFATTVDRDLGNPAQPLTQYHLFNVSSAPGSWTARLNGETLLSTNVNTVGYWSDFALGVEANSSFLMAGEIAEVLMFSRQLTLSEVGTINLYLNDKYSFVTGQDASVALAARTLSGTEVALSWRQPGSSSASSYAIERGVSTNGPFASIGQVSGLMRYVDETAVPQTAYVYRVRNVFSAATDPYSNLAQVETPASSTGFPLASVAIWLRAEDIAVADGASVASWPDFWQTAQAATQTTPADQPTLGTNGLNGRAAVAFSGGKYFQLPSVLSNAPEGEVFIVLSSTTNSPAANQGLWQFNTNAASYYPAVGGGIQDAFGSTNSRTLVSPFADVRTGAVYNVAAATNLWRARLNGPVRQSLLTNTVAFNGTPLLGRSTQGASEPFAGRIAELIVFNRVLTLAEQKTVRDSLAQRYGITLELPQAPSGLSLIRTNGTDYHLSWTALTGSQNGLESYLVVERRADTNAPFVPLQALARTDTAYGDGSGLADVDYGFRLRMVNDVGETTSQTLTATLTDTDGDGVPDYLETILGTNPNNADTDGDGLPDGWELKYGLNPRSANGRDGAAGDFDNDGISNLDEYQQGGDPANGATGDNSSIRLRIHRPN